jgi:hypothetical protein
MAMRRAQVTAVFASLLIAASVGAILAHRPLFARPGAATADRPLRIPDHLISWVVYARLNQPGQVDHYTFAAKAGDPVFIQMIVPRLKRLAGFHPTFALIGPGLPPAGALIGPGGAVYRLSPGQGAMLFPYQGKSVDFFEPFTQTRYRLLQKAELKAPAAGDYRVAVRAPDAQIGRYALAVGTREHWGIADVFRFPVIWLKARFWYQPWSAWLSIVIVAISIVGLGWVLLLPMQKHRHS